MNKRSVVPALLAVCLGMMSCLFGCGGIQENASSVNEKTSSEDAPADISAETSAAWPAQENLKAVDIGEVTKATFAVYTEGGAATGETTDMKQLEELYLRLCNVRIARESDMGVDDDGLKLELEAGSTSYSFYFEGDILVLEDGSRYEVEQLDSLKSYVQSLLEENEGQTDTEDEKEDYLVFASETMGFSFLYEPRHTAYIGSGGAAMVAIDGDENRTGLFISVSDAENLPAVDEYFEEEIFNLQQRYQNAMAMQPELDTTSIEGHDLTGIVYAYSMPEGGTVDCTEFVEVRDGKYIFYDTRAPRDAGGPELEALGMAIASLQLDADFYGASDAISGSLPIDDHEKADASVSNNAAGQTSKEGGGRDRADAEPVDSGTSVSSSDFKGGFIFDVSGTYLIISDEMTTQVYTGGTMDGSYFSVSIVTLEYDIGTTVVNRQHEITDMMGERMVKAPEVELLEAGDRRLAGLSCAYSAVDGSKTICSEEYYEEIDGTTYEWYAIYDKGDTVTQTAMEHAMETFSIK